MNNLTDTGSGPRGENLTSLNSGSKINLHVVSPCIANRQVDSLYYRPSLSLRFTFLTISENAFFIIDHRVIPFFLTIGPVEIYLIDRHNYPAVGPLTSFFADDNFWDRGSVNKITSLPRVDSNFILLSVESLTFPFPKRSLIQKSLHLPIL